MTVGQFVWTPFAAEQTSSGYEVALTYAGSYGFWYTDTNGNVLSGPSGSVQSFEPSFQQDLNGDNLIAIPSAGSLELSGGNSPSVQFQGSTGTLTLDFSYLFSGQISGFTGAGTPSNSDQIDLKDVNYNSSSFSHSFNQTTDVLTVNDGTHTANLHFVGNYAAQNFKFASDGGSGTTVYDPPAPSGVSTLDGHGFMLDGDLHEAVTAQASAVKALLGGFAVGGAEPAPENEPAPGGFDILIRSLLTQHDLHVS